MVEGDGQCLAATVEVDSSRWDGDLEDLGDLLDRTVFEIVKRNGCALVAWQLRHRVPDAVVRSFRSGQSGGFGNSDHSPEFGCSALGGTQG